MPRIVITDSLLHSHEHVHSVYNRLDNGMPRANIIGMSDVKDYTFFGQAVTQAEFAVLIRSIVQEHKCPYCDKPAFVRCGLIAHGKHCKAIPEQGRS